MTLLHGDCLELMKDIPDKSVDLVMTDPPYGINADKGSDGFGVAKGRRYRGGGTLQSRPKRLLTTCFALAKM